MQILFAISIVCLLSVVLATIVVARRIRITPQPDRTSSLPPPDFAHHLFNAVEEELSLNPRKISYQNLQDITARKSWNRSPEDVTVQPSHELRSDPAPFDSEQIPAERQTAHRTGSERLNWAYFNKNLGESTDLYQTPSIRVYSRNSPKRF